ncbi:MAG TPA: hypothetical protein VJ488_06295 [Dehalococcoidia bacterium]|nr:hypothetical protein [Dehalococcoidia bacterium]
MGKRDFGKREQKKPKKDAKKTLKIDILPQVNVEVIKKGKKDREEEF